MNEWNIFLYTSIEKDLERETNGEDGIKTQTINPKEDVLTNKNKTKEPHGDKDNMRKEHAIDGDDKDKNNKKGNNEDGEHLEKHWEHVEERNSASMSNIGK